MTTPPPSPDSSREAFERWASGEPYCATNFQRIVANIYFPETIGAYTNDRLQLMWLAWQEAQRGKAEVVEALNPSKFATVTSEMTNAAVEASKKRLSGYTKEQRAELLAKAKRRIRRGLTD